MAVAIEPGATFRPSAPRELFRTDLRAHPTREYRSYAPFADGQRFVIDVMKERSTTLLTLVTNWTAPPGAGR